MTLLVVSTVLLWLLSLVLTVLVILLYRQFGLLYLGSGARVRLQGVQPGHRAPALLPAVGANGENLVLDWSAPGPGRATLLLLTVPECPFAEGIVPELDDFAKTWMTAVDVTVVDRAAQDVPPSRRLPIERIWRYTSSPQGAVHRAFDIDVSPYAYVIDSEGVVRSREIVNDVLGLAEVVKSATSGFQASRPEGVEIPVRLVGGP